MAPSKLRPRPSKDTYDMAIRIDLLPRYVNLRRWFKRTMAACLALVGVFAVALFAFYYIEQLRLQTMQENRDTFEAIAKKADAADKEATAAETQAKPLQDTVNFFVDAGRTGPERAALLDIVHRYIYRGAVINQMDLSDGQTIKLTAVVKTPDEYANFLNILRQGAVPTGIAFQGAPSGGGIKGWPATSGGTTQPGGQAAAPAPGAAPTPAPAPGTTVDPGLDALKFQLFPNTITAQGTLREPIVPPLPPGENPVAAAVAGAVPGQPAPPVTPPPAKTN